MNSFKLKVSGRRALFSRPEMKVERVSYDVMTPSAARGVLEAIHWKPQMVWRIERIRVLNQIRFESIRRNEVGSKIPAGKIASAMRAQSTDGLALYVDEDRQQRASTLLKEVAYIIEARVELSAKGRADPSESVQKHLEMARRRAAKGQYFHHPYLGTREFACDFELWEGEAPAPHDSLQGERDLGWMVLDVDYAPGMEAKFFRAVMKDGVIEIPASGDAGIVS
ncbi:type I-C CRISPR-associated protein Cas5 [Acidisoma cellulosilytica]|uniref:pre-crRNA processing endonuclease n=1 Tax=Acidisoma cellulosilyticum TaxID=2802395 RepID=A0A963Z045_9PROT|nr:type I-C CRISPR-associated protein Cas5c [Acidisoma cellulosilyticum]MCB8879380.1 type I-C CRISPR-associated protein Cas5 [Acidisoma cellulosilyticum]